MACPPQNAANWLNGDGGLVDTPVWRTARTWEHSFLLPHTDYTYLFRSRNAFGIESETVSFSTSTHMLNGPVLGSPAGKALHGKKVVLSGVSTNVNQALIEWEILSASAPIVGYSLSMSTDPSISTDSAIDVAVTHVQGDNYTWQVDLRGKQKNVYFLKIRCLDAQGLWSNESVFVYCFKNDWVNPKLNAFTPPGTVKLYKDMYYGMPLKPEFRFCFDESVSSGTLTSENIYLVARADHRENEINERCQSVIRYDDEQHAVLLSADLQPNWCYELVVTTNVLDSVGNPLDSEYRASFRALLSASQQQEYVMKAAKGSKLHAEVVLPEGCLQNDSYMIVNESPCESPARAPALAFSEAASKLGGRLVLWEIEINRYSADGTNADEDLSQASTIKMSYVDENNDGIVDGTSMRADQLSVWHLDEERRAWMKLPSSLDRENHFVAAQVKHFSSFALIGIPNLSVNDVKCFPVPWVPAGNKASTGNKDDGITFMGLPEQGEISIYTITGMLVRKIAFESNIEGVVQWDGTNEAEETTASGVYLWIVKSPDGKKTGKLMIVR